MRTGSFSSHVASMKSQVVAASAPEVPADHLRLHASTSGVVLAHREKISAGVPGCTCGRAYPADSSLHFVVRHAHHVADEVLSHVLAAAIAGIPDDQDAFGRDPARWSAGVYDSETALLAISNMARRETEQIRSKETTPA